MGDIIHAMVALEFIRRYFPNSQVDWIVEEVFAPILEDNPDISNVLKLNIKSIKDNKLEFFVQMKKIKSYAKNGYDIVIDAQGLVKSAIVSKVLSSKNIWGFDENSIREKFACKFYHKFVNIPYEANTIDRNAKMLSFPFGFRILKSQIIEKKPFLFFNLNSIPESTFSHLHQNRKNIVFVIGSTWESRNYPKEKFARISNILRENVLIIWGNREEKDKAKWIEKNSIYAKAMPQLDINSLKALISKVDLVIGNDTGPTHIAWGLNIPSITIFGPTPVNRIYITEINKAIKSDSIVNPQKLDKNDFSIRDIDEKEIVKMAKTLCGK